MARRRPEVRGQLAPNSVFGEVRGRTLARSSNHAGKREKCRKIAIFCPSLPSPKPMKTRILFPLALPVLFLLSSCSSGISVTTTRFSGVVIDKSMVVEVGPIHGRDSEEFREELVAAVRSNESFGAEAEPGHPFATLAIEGTYTPTVEETSSTETVDGKTTEKTDRTYTARFDYRILHRESETEITFGNLEESKSRSYEQESTSFFESILNAIVSLIITGDPYASLREDLVARFIGEISPHELTVKVTLFEDSDMPELEQGILQARSGRWKEALGIFLNAIDRYRTHENIHKAYYDAGVAYEYTHQYRLAREFMEKALDLSPEADYAEELRRCIRYEQEWRWREGYLEKLRMVKGKG